MAQIDKPNTQFNTVLYTGNGSTQSITGVNFQPDFVWLKERNNVASHKLYDIVRGATEVLESDGTYAEGTDVNGLTAFNSDGFSLGSSGSNNGSGDTYASWNWKAGGTAVSNTDGSITSSVSANTTSGFSIVSFTSNNTSGATIGHGLGVAPSMVIVKRRSTAEDWGVGHQSLGWTKFIRLNTSAAEATSAGLWNDTAPSSTVVTLGSSGISNPTSGTTMIAYCFAEKKGFSKVGSYTGTATAGASVNNFQYCGFKPALVLIKHILAVGTNENWVLFDNKRNGYNYQNNYLSPDTSSAETSAPNTGIDFLSNGFNPYYGTGTINRDVKSYVWFAIAENPLVGSNNIPTTAR